ncbi:MAG: hypothetical protein M0T70_00145 [Geobacteraceae bacterium]|nr:hypothetical protein [Geobacteraceae bacterium]
MSVVQLSFDELYAPEPSYIAKVEELILSAFKAYQQPSAYELVERVEGKFGVKARWDIHAAISSLADKDYVTRSNKAYLESLIESGDLDEALNGGEAPRKAITSSIDVLLHQSRDYKTSAKFNEMIRFIARFRDYAPYNNMLVRIQNPTCGYYATAKDWEERFGRFLKEDARPMLILAPMHPVMLVYDLDQTEGAPLPDHLSDFASFDGEWDDHWLERALENATTRDMIRVDFKTLSSTNAGFATLARGDQNSKMRIAIHNELNAPSRFGVLCHELAHIYLGHLGNDEDNWWPSRSNLSRHTVEIEAEAVAYIVTNRLGLAGASAAYVSRHLTSGELPASVSLDLIAKVAGKIEQMALEKQAPRRPKQNRNKK